MKNLLPLVVFLAVMTVPFVMKEYPELPSRVVYASDLIIGIVASIVIARLVATQRILNVPLRYVLVFLVFSYVVFCGTLLNRVEPDVTFAGLRIYFKYVPLFLLPFAYEYSTRDIKKLLVALLAIALIQVPVSFYQKFFDTEAANIGTGDAVTGTMKLSTSLSIFEVSTILLIVAFHLGGRISRGMAIILCLLAVIPTAIDETKVTPILLVVGLAVILFVKRAEIASKHIAAVVALVGLMGIGFVGIYDRLYGSTSASGGYIDRMTSSEHVLGGYNLKGARAETLDSFRHRPELVAPPIRLLAHDSPAVGRLDSLRMPFDVLLSDRPMLLAFGLGVGNVVSTFGDRAYGNIAERLNAQATTTTILIWETGVFGALSFLVFLGITLRDSLYLSTQREWSDFGAGWSSVCAIAILLCFYTNLFGLPELLAPYCFFCGFVAATVAQIRRRAHAGAKEVVQSKTDSTGSRIRPPVTRQSSVAGVFRVRS